MDEQEIMTTEGAEADGFMDGWDETSLGPAEMASADPMGRYGASPNLEEPERTGEAVDSGDQAVQEAEEPESAGDEIGTGETDSHVGAPPLLGMTTGDGSGPNGDDGRTDEEMPGQAVPQEAPRTWELNHLGQRITANEADLVTLAQKGLDYDRIRSEYDEARPVMAMFREFAGKAGKSVPEYLTSIREQAKQAEGMSQEEARRAVDLEDREAVVAQQEAVRRQMEEAQRQEAARRQAVDARMQADLREFREVFPEAARDPASIPPEVWAAVRDGRTLVGAYAAYSQRAGQEAAAREEALRVQQARNEAASTGSMRSQDGGKGPKDPFAEGFDEE